jgi:copper chaperone CopZ
MTCGSCIAEVMELVRELPGVSGVTVAYNAYEASPMLIESRATVPANDLRAALALGGFRLSGTSRRHARHLVRSVREGLT